MGLLDDAIREHLDLKRRRGADPSEIAREEQEALGPPRRSAEPLAAPAPVRAQRVEREEGRIGDTGDDIRWEGDGAAEDAPTAFTRPLTQDPASGARGGELSPIEVRHVDDGEDDAVGVDQGPAGPEAVEPPPAAEPVWRSSPPPPDPELEWEAPPPPPDAEPGREAPSPQSYAEPGWEAPSPQSYAEPGWEAPPPQPDAAWEAPPEPRPEWEATEPEPRPMAPDESALLEEVDELDLDEFAGGETDEFVFEDEDFFGDELEDPRPAAHEPPFEPFAGPPAPAPEPPAPEPPAPEPARPPHPPEPPPPAYLATPEPEPPPLPEGDQPTQQYSVADIDEATRHRPGVEPEPGLGGDEETPEGEGLLEETPEGEDLLEETPEFLEETPEHDRLWFEQKPPRDFDF